MSEMEPLTQLLRRAGQGEAEARERAANAVYEELKQTAHRLMAREKNITLQPTSLVNEAFMKLLQSDAMARAPDRAYFFAAAAQAMRRLLVDEFRRRNALKNGGGLRRQQLDIALEEYVDQKIDLCELDEALNQLQAVSERQAKIVHLRWFMQFTVAQVAELLELSPSTVEADWRVARAFLFQRLSDS